jgi:hypothetical protein
MSRDDTSYISLRPFNTGIGDLGLYQDERYQNNTGLVQQSRVGRSTEIEAINRMRWGDPIPASDRIGELRAMGWKRCARCGHYKEPVAFSTYKKKGYETNYLHTYCKVCRADMDRTKRWSHVVPADPYPKRLA